MFVNQCGTNVHGITLTIFNSLYPYIKRMKLSPAASNNSLAFMPFIKMIMNLYIPVWVNKYIDIYRPTLLVFYVTIFICWSLQLYLLSIYSTFQWTDQNSFSRASSFPYYTFKVRGLGHVVLSQDLSNRLLSFMGKVTSKIFCSIPQCPNSLLTQKETKHEPETEY